MKSNKSIIYIYIPIKNQTELICRTPFAGIFTRSIWEQRRKQISQWRAPSRGRRCAPPDQWGYWWCSWGRGTRRSGWSWCRTYTRLAEGCCSPSRCRRHLSSGIANLAHNFYISPITAAVEILSTVIYHIASPTVVTHTSVSIVSVVHLV